MQAAIAENLKKRYAQPHGMFLCPVFFGLATVSEAHTTRTSLAWLLGLACAFCFEFSGAVFPLEVGERKAVAVAGEQQQRRQESLVCNGSTFTGHRANPP
jgi:hypothetical protein